MDAGPSSNTAFHIVGAQFDTLYKEGAYLLRKETRAVPRSSTWPPGQGGFAEAVIPAPGHYPFVDHDMRHAETGAHGTLHVSK